jgi:folate-binding protein YgfZ
MSGSHVAVLDHLSVVDVRGADAAAFLQAQLCGDVLAMAAGQCRLTAWCTAKGRVIASFLLARGASGFRMILYRDIGPRFLQKLRLYVLRSRVELVDRGADLGIAGRYGAPAAPPVPAREWHYEEQAEVVALALPGSTGPRQLLIGPAAALAAYAPAAGHAPGWTREDVLAGIPWIGSALSEEFLPQELDLERFGGLSYTKGCFPGQEIIQRVHSRGRLKRALHRFSADGAPPAAAARIVGADGTTHGLVIAAAASDPGGSTGLAVVDTGSRGREPLHLDKPDGPLLRFDAEER